MLNEWVAGCATGLDGSASRLNLWLRTLFECLAVPIECVAGCAHCLKGWQCQLSASLDAHVALPTMERLGVHIARMDASDNY